MLQIDGWKRPIAAATLVTLGVTAASYWLPAEVSGTAVALGFFAATYGLVLRGNPEKIRRYGLSFAGLLEPSPLEPQRLIRTTLCAVLFTLLMGLLVFPAFWLGYQLWFSPDQPFELRFADSPVDEVLAQVFAVALPEEMFYRGYLQSALDEVWRPRWRWLGAQVGWGLIVSSAIFALGHFATTPDPTRLAVVFPSLLFGWMRARSGGVGAAVLFHAACNLFSAHLARGYGFME